MAASVLSKIGATTSGFTTATSVTTGGIATTTGSDYYVIVINNGSVEPSSVTDSNGNTYLKTGLTYSRGGLRFTAWFSESGTGSAAHTFTVTLPVAANIVLMAHELGGLADNPVDALTGKGDVCCADYEVPSGALAQADELLIVASAIGTGGISFPIVDNLAAWTREVDSPGTLTPINTASWSQVVSSTASVLTSFTQTGSSSWQGGIMTTFKAAIGGGIPGGVASINATGAASTVGTATRASAAAVSALSQPIASSTKIASGFASASAAAGIVVAGAMLASGMAVLAAQGQPQSSGSAIRSGSVAIAASAQPSTSASATRIGSAAIAADGSITVNGVSSRSGSAGIGAGAAPITAGESTRFGSALLTATASLAADGAALSQMQSGVAVLQATAQLNAIGTATRSGSTWSVASGDATASGIATRAGTASLSAFVTPSAAGSQPAVVAPDWSRITVTGSIERSTQIIASVERVLMLSGRVARKIEMDGAV